MLTIDMLYHLFKPLNNENFITEFPLIIGGGGGALDIVKGGWILSPLRSQVLNKGDYKPLFKQDDKLYSKLTDLIQTDYQLDFFINPSDKEKAVIHFKEAERMRTYLKSIDCIMYLRALKAEILPSIKEIKYFSEFAEQKIFVNRAILEFSIISNSIYSQEFKEFDNARIIKNYLTDNGTLKEQDLNLKIGRS